MPPAYNICRRRICMKTKAKTDRSNYLFDNKALFVLILPLVVEQLLAVLVGMADSIMIASVGEAAVSGVSLVDQIMVLLISLFSALATGGTVVAGQYLGQRNEKEACRSTTQLVWFVTIFALAVTAVIYLGKDVILHTVFGKIEPDVMAHANIYLLIVTASIPFIALYNGGAAIFRAMGNSEISMKVSILMNGINVCGNALLIYGFHRGTEGVAIPTLVSRMVAAIVIIALLCNEKLTLHVEKTLRYKPDWSLIKKILSIGVPNGLENSMFQLGKVLVLSLVSTFGTSAIAANAVGNTFALFQIIPGMAISLAITTVIARCVGAGDYEQAKYYNKKLLMIIYVGMAAVVTLTLLILPFVLKIYNLSDATEKSATQIIWLHGIVGIALWPLAFSLPATFRASGDAKMCMLISVASMWIFRIVFAHILGKYFGLGVIGVWIAMMIDWVFRAGCFVVRYFSGKWKKAAIAG